MLNTTAIGNLGNDAAVKNVNGKNVIEFSIAHTERYKDATGQKKERTTWVNCAYWVESTIVAQYMKKGAKVFVTGTPSVRAYIPKDSRDPAAAFNLRVDRIELLDRKPDAAGHSGPATAASSQPAATGWTADVADDLPF